MSYLITSSDMIWDYKTWVAEKFMFILWCFFCLWHVCKSLFSVGAVLLTTESWMSWFCILNVRTNEGCVDHIQWQIVPIHFFYIPLWVSFVNLQNKTIISIFYNLQLQCMQYIMSVILTFFLICVDKCGCEIVGTIVRYCWIFSMPHSIE